MMVPSLPPVPFDLDGGRYSVLEKVGRGHFGNVYRGFDHDQHEQVAIKILQPGVVIDAVVREASNQAKLRGHDHIAALLNVRLIPPRSFMVMEYLSAGSVRARWEAGAANLIDIIRWVRNGLDGLAYAHSNGILHRDFKPGNLMLAPNDTAKLSDFGIAEDTVRGDKVAELYGALWAPELLAKQPSSVQTDIWAVGCTLYFLLTGQYPFGNPVDVAAVNTGAYPAIHAANRQVPASVVRVVAKALDVNPASRYQSAWDMLAELLACQVHRAWRPSSDPTAEEAWETCDDQAPLRATIRVARRGAHTVAVQRLTAAGRWIALPGSRTTNTLAMARRLLGNQLRHHVQKSPP